MGTTRNAELKDLAAALRRRRATSGQSQRALAARLGVHQPQIAKAEAGGDMLVSRLQDMARALGCELMLVPAGRSAELATDLGEPGGTAARRQDATGQPEGRGTSLLEAYGREWPDIDPHVFVITVHLQRAAQLIETGMTRLAAGHGLNRGEVLVLGALRRLGAPYQSSLSELRKQFWITLPGMSKRIGHLERLGFVDRVANPHDRRGTLIRLTRKGLALQAEQVRRPTRAFQAIRNMPAAERLRLSAALAGLLDLIEEPGAPVKK